MTELKSSNEIVSIKNTNILSALKLNDTLLTVDDLVIRVGESVFIEGKSASGKTVLLKTLRECPEIENGIISYPIKKNSLKKHSAQYVCLQPAAIMNRTVIENVLLPLSKVTLRIKHRLLELLHQYDMDDRRDDKVSTLSFSELIKLQIVRAELVHPSLLLIDDYNVLVKFIREDSLGSVVSVIVKNGGSVVAAGNEAAKGFDSYFRIHNKILKQMDSQTNIETDL